MPDIAAMPLLFMDSFQVGLKQGAVKDKGQ